MLCKVRNGARLAYAQRFVSQAMTIHASVKPYLPIGRNGAWNRPKRF